MNARSLSLTVLLALTLLAPPSEAEGRRRPKRARATRVAEAQPKSPEAPAPAPKTEPAPPATRGPTRIDFDDRLIQGQTNAAGSVYLYDRKELELHPMVDQRRTFLKELWARVFTN